MNPLEEWKRLQDGSALYRAVRADQEESHWSRYALNYDLRRNRGRGVDRELELVLSLLTPSMSVLEIGAGTGAYTKHIADKVSRVTVVEPSPSMIRALERNLRSSGIENVDVHQRRWEDAEEEPHDVVLAAGCMYVFYEVREALAKMTQKAEKTLILIYGRNNQLDIYREAAGMLGVSPPSAGPDYIHLYNVLYDMGVHANVKIFKSKRSLIYDDMDHAMRVWSERMELPEEKMDRLREYLDERLRPEPTGKLTLGEVDGVNAVIWRMIEDSAG